MIRFEPKPEQSKPDPSKLEPKKPEPKKPEREKPEREKPGQAKSIATTETKGKPSPAQAAPDSAPPDEKPASKPAAKSGAKPDVKTSVAPEAIQATMQALVQSRGADKTICPSDVARALGGDHPDAWGPLMIPVRRVAVKLAQAGDVVIYRKGKPVAPDDVKGVYRIGLPRPAGT
jgi:hypothetical protein